MNLNGGFPKLFCAAIQEARSCIDGDAPCSIDYRKVEGCPYKARFGDELGMLKLKEACTSMKDIRDYIIFMVDTAKEFYKETAEATTFKIYHDALQVRIPLLPGTRFIHTVLPASSGGEQA